MSAGTPKSEPVSVNEGVAIMQAWCRYLGVSDNTTVIVPPDFAAGYMAAKERYLRVLVEAAVPLEALRMVQAGGLLSREMKAEIVRATDLIRGVL